jgi:hypothetical protein
MAKRSAARKTRRMRGGVWYNPMTWFAAAPEEPVPSVLSENPSPSVPDAYPRAENPPAMGGKKRRKTRRGGSRHRSKASKIYGH